MVAVIRGALPDGYGYGYGSGYGSGDIVAANPSPITVTVDHLVSKEACGDQVRRFRQAFKDGGVWPRDIDLARANGLDIEWAVKNLGLLIPEP